MQTFELVPTLWNDYFDAVTREASGSAALVQAGACAVADGSGGANGRPLRAISFDAERCEIAIDVGAPSAAGPAVRYYVERPRRIVVSEGDDSLRILILGTDGLRTAVSLERIPVTRGSGSPSLMPA